jgi:hypothetical protein
MTFGVVTPSKAIALSYASSGSSLRPARKRATGVSSSGVSASANSQHATAFSVGRDRSR